MILHFKLITNSFRCSVFIVECACKQGKPCSCGYSPEQCAIHCTARGSSPSPRPYNSGYVLPVRYNNGGDYVVYELPQDASTQQLRRTARQAPLEIPSLTPASEAIQNLVNNDRFRAVADRIRDRISKLTGGDGGEIKLGAPLDISALRNRFGTSDTQLGAPLDISSLRDRFSSIADATVSHATKFVENLSQRFSAPTLPTRRKREAPMTEEERREMDKRIPMLRVKEYAASREKNDDISKYTTISRVELKAGDQQEAWNKKDTYCNECGSKLTDSVCKQCGSHQPQYVEFIQGKPVSFYPGAKRPQTTTEAPRYIFDRYGHKYLENNGNLRLIAPQQYQEAIVGDQPNFAGLADILNRNQEVIQQLNPGIAPGRMIQEPVDFATGAIDLVRDLARREIKRSDKEKSERSSTVEEKNEKESERHAPRSMYQVVPMHYEGQDGKLVVKVYSSKEDKINPETQKFRYDEGITADTDSAKEYDSTNKSKPKIYKFNKNEKEFEILSFEDYKNNSNDDIRQVLEHLHGKQSW